MDATLIIKALVALYFSASAVALRKITIDNQCSGDIFPAIQSGAGMAPPTTLSGSPQPGGWSQPPGIYSFNVPDHWEASRIWGRTGCQPDGSGCKIGACGSNTKTCTGLEPGSGGATLAEFTIVDTGAGDSYDISLVDGFNLPMTITPSLPANGVSCYKPSCAVDLLTKCDPSLIWPHGSSQIWGCASPCLAGVDFQSIKPGPFDYLNSPTCCTGKWADQKACFSNMIPFYNAYKAMCPDTYIFAKDDNYANAVFNCPGKPDYTVTFCPGGVGSGLNPGTTPVKQEIGPGPAGGPISVPASPPPVQVTSAPVAVTTPAATSVPPVTPSTATTTPITGPVTSIINKPAVTITRPAGGRPQGGVLAAVTSTITVVQTFTRTAVGRREVQRRERSRGKEAFRRAISNATLHV